MRYLHFSAAPLGAFTPALDQRVHYKPRGLWLSAGEAWADWCRAEDFRVEQLACVTEVDVSAKRLLVLTNVRQMADFTTRYGVRQGYGTLIDWALVAQKYEGIAIPEYLDYDADWYGTWDIGCACIWA